MANFRPVIKGLNASWKFVTRGFGQFVISGEKVEICSIWTKPYVCEKLSTNSYVDMKVSTT